jgi:hypothetical protein
MAKPALQPDAVQFIGGNADGLAPHCQPADLYEVTKNNSTDYYEAGEPGTAIHTEQARQRWEEAFGNG